MPKGVPVYGLKDDVEELQKKVSQLEMVSLSPAASCARCFVRFEPEEPVLLVPGSVWGHALVPVHEACPPMGTGPGSRPLGPRCGVDFCLEDGVLVDIGQDASVVVKYRAIAARKVRCKKHLSR